MRGPFGLILLFSLPAAKAVLCYTCQNNPYGIIARSPLFKENFFSIVNDSSCWSVQNGHQTIIECDSFCIAQYVQEKFILMGITRTKDTFFRACADDVLLGTINMDGKTSCKGLIKQYNSNGFPNNNGPFVYWETGMGFACTSDLCNAQSEDDVRKIVTQTCSPCQNTDGCKSGCVTLDGYSAKCDCVDSSNIVTCGTNPSLSNTTNTTTTSTSTISTSSTTSTATKSTYTTILATTKSTTVTITTTGNTFSNNTATSSSIGSKASSSSTTNTIATTTTGIPSIFSVGFIAGVSVGSSLLTLLVVSLVCWKTRRRFVRTEPEVQYELNHVPVERQERVKDTVHKEKHKIEDPDRESVHYYSSVPPITHRSDYEVPNRIRTRK